MYFKEKIYIQSPNTPKNIAQSLLLVQLRRKKKSIKKTH